MPPFDQSKQPQHAKLWDHRTVDGWDPSKHSMVPKSTDLQQAIVKGSFKKNWLLWPRPPLDDCRAMGVPERGVDGGYQQQSVLRRWQLSSANPTPFA